MKEYLRLIGIDVDSGILSDSAYTNISLWREWYSGFVQSFHVYTQYNGRKHIKRHRASLNMAKKVCEDWANLLLNEKLTVTTDDEALTDTVNSIFDSNNFRVRANRLCELTFALGTGAFCEYIDGNGNVRIDYLQADMIYPLSASGERITECAFCSKKVIGGKSCVYVQAHRLIDGEYVIFNRLFDEKTSKAVQLPDGILGEFRTGSSLPLFQIITPNIINNSDTFSPMGISIYANAISVLSGVDLIYDSYLNEFRLGKKRVYVPISMSQITKEEEGYSTPIFDDNDTEFFAMPDEVSEKLSETDFKIRSSEHTEGINTSLDILSDRCGLGTGRYVYHNSGVKTATEVISENSALYQNLSKHKLILSDAIKGLVRAILWLSEKVQDVDITVDFDDSIIHDTAAEFSRNLQLVSSGLMAKWEFRAWWFGESEEQARAAISEIAGEDGGEFFEE